MKRVLGKRWLGIPAVAMVVVLVLALTAGGVLAAYTAWTGTANVTVGEALSVSLAAAPDASLNLENKDSAWAVIVDGTSGVVTYNLAGPTFDYALTATGLTASQGYSLIYYADEPNRYVNWGGDNPGALIGTATSDGTGSIAASGSMALGISLPTAPDANISLYSYGGPPDNYSNAHGAKLWLVPTSSYSAPAVTSWQPATFLFETDLIAYRYDASAGMAFSGDTVTVTGLMPGETWAFEVTITNASTAALSVTLTPSDPYSEVRMDVGGGLGQANTVTVSGLSAVTLTGSITASSSAVPGTGYTFTIAVSR